jgi:malonate-semialdehyde dehydrogenase (acetylating)/methylmalonate-semialdehyde dehydrogenase
VFQQAIRSNATCGAIPKVPMYIDGKFVESKTNDWIDVHNPATNEVSSIFLLSNYLRSKNKFA